MSTILAWLGGGLGVIFFLLIGIAQAIVGYLGIEYHLGTGLAIGCIIASFIFRITFPLTIYIKSFIDIKHYYKNYILLL